MLVSFGSMDAADMAMMNRLTGMAVCLFIWLLGIFTMRKGRKRRKKSIVSALLYGSYDCCGDFVKTVGCNGNHDNLIMFHSDILRKTDIDQFRVIFSASIGLLINILYAFYHGMLGLMNQSLWFVAMGAYYVVLGAMRFSAVLCEWRDPAK